MSSWRRSALLQIGAAAVVVGLLAGCASSAGNPKHAARRPVPTSSPTTPINPTTSAPAPATAPPTTATTTSTTAVVGDPNGPVVSAEGAQLAPPTSPQRARPMPRDCRALASAGTSAQCGTGQGATADLLWLIDRLASGGTAVTVFRVVGGVATPVLQARDSDGSAWRAVHVVVGDIGGPPGSELLVGFRSTTTSGLLQVDAVGGAGTVSFHRELDQGRALVFGGHYLDWGARFGPNDPNCCPSVYGQSLIAFENGAWRVVQAANVSPTQAPRGVFP